MSDPIKTESVSGALGMSQVNGLVFSSLAYINGPQTESQQRESRAALGGGWLAGDDTSRELSKQPRLNLGVDYNVQRRASDREIQNAFEIYVDDANKKIAISFKGSTLIDNFHSNLTDGGKREFLLIEDKAQKALAFLKETHPGYEIFTTGHSLAGGQAQTFGLKNNLSIQVVNSLPIRLRSPTRSGLCGRPRRHRPISSIHAPCGPKSCYKAHECCSTTIQMCLRVFLFIVK